MRTNFQARQEDMRRGARMVEQELDVFIQAGLGHTSAQSLVPALRERLAAQPLRAYFVQKLYDCAKGTLGLPQQLRAETSQLDALFERKIAFVFEVVIHIQYLHNHILDKKAGVDSPARINEVLLAANRLKDMLYLYLDEQMPRRYRDPVTQAVRRLFMWVDMGQEIEKRWGTYDAMRQRGQHEQWLAQAREETRAVPLFGLDLLSAQLHKDLPRGLWDFGDLYLHRIYLTCAALFVTAADLVATLTRCSQPVRQQLLQFAGSYGLMRQLVNDNADYTPAAHQLSTRDKAAQDALSDLRNRNVTLPLLLHLAEAGDRQADVVSAYLDGTCEVPPQGQAVLDALLGSQALCQSIQYAKLMAADATAQLPADNPAAAFLADTCAIAHWNKFLFPVLKTAAYKSYRKSAHYRLIKQKPAQVAASPVTAWASFARTGAMLPSWLYPPEVQTTR